MNSFEKFSEWKKNQFSVYEEKENPNTVELITELEELISRRKKAIHEKDNYESKILEIEIKLKRLEIEKLDLMQKHKDLSEAKEIAKKRKIEGITHEQE